MIVKFEKGDSFLHRLNPLAKLSAVVAYSLVAVLLAGLRLELLCIASVLVMERIAGCRQIFAFMLSRFVLVLMIVIVIVQTIMTRSGTVLVTLPLYVASLHITDAGLLNGAVIAMRFVSIVLVGALFVSTTNPVDLVYSLMQIGVPYRYGFMAVLALRLTTVFQQEAKTLTNAQKMRGLNVEESGVKGLLRCIRCTVMPLIVCALARVDDLVVSMEGRAFGCKRSRTFVAVSRYRAIDKALVFAALAVALWVLLDLCFGWYPLPRLRPY
ncbi:MAG: energy-coupling factor transporter transmembrane component T [Syntrophobacteraceae bacterium]|nr:energy-coupling factor transporter transmembrane component T [Syntrophobacteraceae bacterium]